MSRPLRIEYPGACSYVTARGNGGQPVFTCAEDGHRFLDLLGREVTQQRWRCHGWCLMENHYHLLIETPEPNLGCGMGRLNMAYSQWFGRRHGRPGHLFAGRYKAILFEKERWLLPLARHAVCNPLRLGLVRRAGQWRWSSHAAVTGEGPPWFVAADLLAALDVGAGDAAAAWDAYVAAGDDSASPWDSLRGGHYLGSEAFLAMLARRIRGRPLDQVARAAARPDRPTADSVLAAIAAVAGIPLDSVLDRRRAPEPYRAAAYLLRRACNLPLREAAALAGVTPARVSQIQRAVEDAGGLARLYPWAAPLERLLAG
jgi:REP element-mobilizing transposase RayT